MSGNFSATQLTGKLLVPVGVPSLPYGSMDYPVMISRESVLTLIAASLSLAISWYPTRQVISIEEPVQPVSFKGQSVTSQASMGIQNRRLKLDGVIKANIAVHTPQHTPPR
jgi:hypothetical protein